MCRSPTLFLPRLVAFRSYQSVRLFRCSVVDCLIDSESNTVSGLGHPISLSCFLFLLVLSICFLCSPILNFPSSLVCLCLLSPNPHY
ncbi:hypothetical protein BDV39DRAFT_16241 [Aspergillus sergii]|uniref:Uncharacterized protein n=1 Tax=Aspergillus sergii TaxID=1034303 RepID=A0A5N6XCL9_9EURO|nr:hypothetical protein BDV39DRAFT_16241 [Aspergillus sergii]